MNETKQKCLKNSATAVTLVIAGIVAGLLLLALVYMLPTWRVNYHIGESMWDLRWESTQTKSGEMLDYFTEGFMLSIIYNKGDSYAEDMLLAKFMSGEKNNPLINLYDYITQSPDNAFAPKSYGRYWHGYQTVLTPLLIFFNVDQIKTLNMAVQLVLVFAIVALLGMRRRADMIIPFAAMYLTLAPVSLFYSFQYSSTFYVMCFLSLAVALKYDKWSFAKLCFAFEVAGIMEAFFDYLTYPAVALAVPMIMFFALDASERKTLVERIKQFVLLCVSWVFGYIGMWSGKWLVATVFTDENIIADAIKNVKFRSSTSQGTDVFNYDLAVTNNLKYLVESNAGLFRLLLVLLVVVWLVCMLNALRRKAGALQATAASAAIIALCCLMPFVWYAGTINHSYLHAPFTFRELSITVYGAMTLLYLALYRKPKTIPDAA